MKTSKKRRATSYRFVRPTAADRRLFAEKSIELGNLMFAGLVIAQIIPGNQPFQFIVFVLGVVGLISMYLIAFGIILVRPHR